MIPSPNVPRCFRCGCLVTNTQAYGHSNHPRQYWCEKCAIAHPPYHVFELIPVMLTKLKRMLKGNPA